MFFFTLTDNGKVLAFVYNNCCGIEDSHYLCVIETTTKTELTNVIEIRIDNKLLFGNCTHEINHNKPTHDSQNNTDVILVCTN